MRGVRKETRSGQASGTTAQQQPGAMGRLPRAMASARLQEMRRGGTVPARPEAGKGFARMGRVRAAALRAPAVRLAERPGGPDSAQDLAAGLEEAG
jgi:hypothetical protein